VDIFSILIFVLPLALLWFFLVLPQQRRQKEHRALLSGIEPGDEVMTTAGLYGRVVELSDDNMYLQVAPGVELKFARGAIARKVAGGQVEPDEDDEDDELDDDDEVGELDEVDETPDTKENDDR